MNDPKVTKHQLETMALLAAFGLRTPAAPTPRPKRGNKFIACRKCGKLARDGYCFACLKADGLVPA